MRQMSHCRSILAFGVMLLAVAHTLASPAEVSGRVTFSGEGVPGAIVTAIQGDRGVTAVTLDSGQFGFTDLGDGTWTIRVEMRGFVTMTREVFTAWCRASSASLLGEAS